MKKHKGKMWVLVNKKTGGIIKIGLIEGFVVGFETKKDLLIWCDGHIEDDEETRKVEFEY